MSDDSYNPYPWGPHGGRQDQPGPPVHPGDAQNPPSFIPAPEYHPVQAPSPYSPGGTYTGPGGNLPYYGAPSGPSLLPNLIFFAIFWEAWVCLYPLSALAGLFTMFRSIPLLRSFLPLSPFIGPYLYSVALAAVLGAVALWTMSRIEHRLARSNFYRIPRHILRLGMIGWGVALAIQKSVGAPYDVRPAAILPLLQDHPHLAMMIGAVIASHFVLWNWAWPREFWRQRMVGARLRPSGI